MLNVAQRAVTGCIHPSSRFRELSVKSQAGILAVIVVGLLLGGAPRALSFQESAQPLTLGELYREVASPRLSALIQAPAPQERVVRKLTAPHGKPRVLTAGSGPIGFSLVLALPEHWSIS